MPVREGPFDDYDILDLSKRRSAQRLLKLFSPTGEPSNGAAYGVLDAIFRHKTLRSAVVESDYIDVDHSRSYSQFYARAFRDHSKRTARVHFFGERITRPKLAGLTSFTDSYLGFVVVRPFAMRNVGRTLIAPPPVPSGGYNFSTVSPRFSANVAGTPMEVEAAPFIEQDARVSACASAALWMATTPSTARLSLQPYTTAEITNFATSHQVGSRRVQSEGLSPDQMSESLRQMGYEPMQVAISDPSAAVKVLYPYIESGLSPVLLVQLRAGRHALAAVGHGYDANLTPSSPVTYDWSGPLGFWRSWQWLDQLLIHDDQRGPYRPLRFIDKARIATYATLMWPGASVAALGMDDWACPVEIEHSYSSAPGGHPPALPTSTIANVYGAIVPLPSGVSLSGIEAERKVARIIAIWARARGFALPQNLHLRTYLASSSEFKKNVQAAALMHPYAQRMYLGKGLPHWLWVTEVGLRDEVVVPHLTDGRIRGEVVIDANGSPWLPDFVALHLPMLDGSGHLTGSGQLSTMRHNDDDVAAAVSRGWQLMNDPAYEPFHRSPI